MRKILSLLAVFMLVCTLAYAQSRTVAGQVRDANGNPIAFATVTEAGTSNAVTADAAGSYRITIRQGAKLTVSATGFQALSVDPTGSVQNVSLVRTDNQLQEVVVTALGIRRRTDLLSNSQQGIKADQLNQTRMTDVNQALAGKISNVQVRTQSG